MNFRYIGKILFPGLLIFAAACSDPDREKNLVDLHTIASQDLVSIDFPLETEDTVSVNSVVDFTLEGTRSNDVDTVTISDGIEWSLSQGAVSSIDQQGRLSSSENAELITLTAKFGILSVSKDIEVSSAAFDRVESIALQDAENSVINMCQSKVIKPVGRYIDEDNNDEIQIRSVDSNTIDTIEWTVTNEEDDGEPLRATIEKVNGQAILHTRAAGNIVIHATVFSHIEESLIMSDFTQAINSAENVSDHDIKVCLSDDTNLTTCGVTSVNVEQDDVISLIAVGKYQDATGSDFYENISRNSQWGISNSGFASIDFSSDRQQLDVTGIIEKFRTTISVACGNIDQSLDEIDIAQGVILDIELSCVNSSETQCLDTSVLVDIDELTVLSFEVRANDVDVTDNVSQVLDSRPDEIELIVKANFANDTQLVITEDDDLDYSILDGQTTVIEETSTDGLFTVVGVGTVKIKLKYRGEEFIVFIVVP